MRHIPGWMVGALSVSALVSAFHLGARVNATPHVAAAVAAEPPRVVTPARDDADIMSTTAAPAVVYVADVANRPVVRPAVLTQPVEVYRPRPRVAAATAPAVERPRSVKKSVAIIGGSTAAGAVVGGLVKGRKGAVIGGLLGGGAAAVWDQVTRRRDDGMR